MELEELIDKLYDLSEEVVSLDIVKDYPRILDILEFILFDCKEKIGDLSVEESQDNILDITTLKAMIFAEVIKKYLELTTTDQYKYEINDLYFMGQTSGYDAKTDTVLISPLGLALNSISDADIIKTIFHEFRHQRQNHFLKLTNFEELLNYPSNFIRVIKNRIPKDLFEELDEEEKIITSPYYNENYTRMYMEIDADLTGLNIPKKMILELYDLYPNKNESLRLKAKKIQEFLIIGECEVERKLIEEGKLHKMDRGEVLNSNMITSYISHKGKEMDSLLFIDKCLKENGNLYPIFSLFMSDNRFKNYMEIIKDKNNYIKRYNHKDKINRIYEYYIQTDPTLIISHLIFNNKKEEIEEFLKMHPTFKKEYQKEIIDIVNMLYAEEDIIDLLVIRKNKKLIKKINNMVK